MKLYKALFVVLLFLFTTLAFPWGSELCQGCRIDSSALAGPIYTFPNSQLFQQMISTNGTFLFQDAIERLPAYSNGIKMEIRTLTNVPLRLAYDMNNYVDFAVGSSGSLTVNSTGSVVISSNGNVIIGNGNVGIGTTMPGAKLDVAGTVSASALVVNGAVTVNQLNVNGTVAYKVVNKTSNYTAGGESIILVNASAGNVTVNLPVASTASGRVYQIKKIDNSENRVSIAGYGSETIDSSAFVTMDNKYASYTVLSDASNWWVTSYVVGVPRPDFATGGTITEVGGYRIHTFTSSGTFTVNRGGNVEYLVVAGGGGGGGDSYTGGGGGAGGVLTGMLSVTPGNKAITIGGGGQVNTVGSNSMFDTITASGGGKGGYLSVGGNGGSGGGGSTGPANSYYAGGLGVSSPIIQGNNGGRGYYAVSAWNGSGGGGGAGTVGSDPVSDGSSSAAGGSGGNGFASSISGISVIYAGGGGGGGYRGYSTGGAAGTGGSGGGGTGAAGDGTVATAGSTNTGGGGGGGSVGDGYSRAGAAGGSGIVIIRYPITQ